MQEGDVLFIPGLDYRLISSNDFLDTISDFLDWVKIQHQQRVHICSVCTGSFLLAETGVLQGKEATTHWKYLESFQTKFPDVELAPNRLFINQDNLYSSAGVSSGIDLSLHLLEVFFGTKFAVSIAKEVVIYFRRSSKDPQLSIFLQYRNHIDQCVHDVQDYIVENLEQGIRIEQLSDEVNMSSRNLTRRFKRTTGITIGVYVERLRVETAVTLLAEGHKLDFVIGKIGLKSSNQLRTLLKRHQNKIPAELSLPQ